MRIELGLVPLELFKKKFGTSSIQERFLVNIFYERQQDQQNEDNDMVGMVHSSFITAAIHFCKVLSKKGTGPVNSGYRQMDIWAALSECGVGVTRCFGPSPSRYSRVNGLSTWLSLDDLYLQREWYRINHKAVPDYERRRPY